MNVYTDNHLPAEPSAHDDSCEADWGIEGQESPCRCAERAIRREKTEIEMIIIEANLFYDEAGSRPLPRLIGPFRDLPSAHEYIGSLGGVWDDWDTAPICVPEARDEPTVATKPAIDAVRQVLDGLEDWEIQPHAVEEIASALGDIPDCESWTAVPHGEHTGGELSAAEVQDVLYFALRDAGQGRTSAEDLSRKLGRALRHAREEGKNEAATVDFMGQPAMNPRFNHARGGVSPA